MSNGRITRVDNEFYESYILKLKEQEAKRGNKNCSDKTATAILKKRLDQAGGLAEYS